MQQPRRPLFQEIIYTDLQSKWFPLPHGYHIARIYRLIDNEMHQPPQLMSLTLDYVLNFSIISLCVLLSFKKIVCFSESFGNFICFHE